MLQNLFVNIEYDDRYKAIEVSTLEGKVKSWGTGDPVADWNSCVAWIIEQDDKYDHVMMMSSSNDFVMDVPGYKWIENEFGNEMLVVDENDLETSASPGIV